MRPPRLPHPLRLPYLPQLPYLPRLARLLSLLPLLFRPFLAPLLALLCLLASPPAAAGALHALRFSQLDIRQGLPSSGVIALHQDGGGFIWLGTVYGLARYDGRRFKIYQSDPADPATLSHALVHSMLEDGQGGLMLGTRGGLDRIDLKDGRVQRLGVPSGLELVERYVFAIAPAGPGRIWIGNGAGLFLYDIAKKTFTPAPVGGGPPPKGRVRALLADGKGGVWFTLEGRLTHVDAQGRLDLPGGPVPLGVDAKGAPRLAFSMALDGGGRLWVGLRDGLQIWRLGPDGPQPDPQAARFGVPPGVVYGILRDQDDAMWFGGNGGLFRWRAGAETLERFTQRPAVPDSLNGDSVAALMLDKAGGLWVGTWGGGVSIADLGRRDFVSYLKVPDDARSLSNPSVFAIVPDGPDHVWLGIYGGGLNRLRLADGDTDRGVGEALGVKRVKALLRDPGGQLWVGGDEGLRRYDPASGRVETVALSPSASVSALLRDRDGLLWASSNDGLFRIDGAGKVRHFKAGKGAGQINHSAVDCLLEDREGRLWVGAKGGLHRWDAAADGFERPIAASPDLPEPDKLAVHAMRQDGGGRIWLATNLGLFELLRQGPGWRLLPWNRLPGMPRFSFEAIETAANGDVWLSSEHGLLRFDPKAKAVRHYPMERFNGAFSFGAAARGPDGSLYFGGPGLVRFQPEALRDNPIPPKVVLTDLLLFNRSVLSGASAVAAAAADTAASGAAPSLAQSIGVAGQLQDARTLTFNHRQNMVSFELSAQHFAHAESNRYAWKLEGFDSDWISGQPGQGLATYTNLNPGRYRLFAKAANPDGVWGAGVQLLEVEVLPPFWRTWWWYGSVALLSLIALRHAYRRRVRALHAANDHLEREVARRTAEVVEQTRHLAHEKLVAVEQREMAEKARRDIAILSGIGREITSSLDVDAIQTTLYRHVNELLRASTFGVGLVLWERRVLVFDFVMENGRRLEPYRRSLDCGEQPSVQCVLEARELQIGEFGFDVRVLGGPGGGARIQLEGGGDSAQARSGLYVPMMNKGQVMGVVGVQSALPNVFSRSDLDILRTLGAYAAVALDNAEAYRRLHLTQSKLVEQEKMAALGSLVAGVAHELNTPIGNSLMAASTLQVAADDFMRNLLAGPIRRSVVEEFCADTQTSSELMVRNLGKAATLIASFKQIAVDQTSNQRREFDLLGECEEVANALARRVQEGGHALKVDIPEYVIMDSFPGPFGQVLTHLIQNSVMHGLDGMDGATPGLITLAGRTLGPDQVELTFRDNGCGICPEHLGRVFEPFFTTKLGQGSSGLGLHISYNIVRSVLGGSITVSSAPGEGACFVIVLPKVAPKVAPTVAPTVAPERS